MFGRTVNITLMINGEPLTIPVFVLCSPNDEIESIAKAALGLLKDAAQNAVVKVDKLRIPPIPV
jgi:hypothetical protein